MPAKVDVGLKPYTVPCLLCGGTVRRTAYEWESRPGGASEVCKGCKATHVADAVYRDASGAEVGRLTLSRYVPGKSFSQWCARNQRLMDAHLAKVPTATQVRFGPDDFDVRGGRTLHRPSQPDTLEGNLASRNATMEG